MWGTKRITAASSSYLTLGHHSTDMQRGAKHRLHIFSLPLPEAQVHEAKGAKQVQERGRRSSLLALAWAAMLLLSNVQAQPAARKEIQSRLPSP